MVVFSNGTDKVVSGTPVIEVRSNRLVAVYRAILAGATITAEGMDQDLNTTPGASAPGEVTQAGYGTGVLGALAAFMHDVNDVISAVQKIITSTEAPVLRWRSMAS